MATPVKDPLTGAETTGHIWDETLQEFNNPLPRWWVWTFYGTIVFTIVYWIMYPSWPIGNTYLKGINEITYKTDAGEEKTTHWNTRALLAHDMQNGTSAIKQQEYLAKVGAASYEQIAQDSDMSSFVRSYGVGMFGDNCAACHQSGGQGVAGMYPNLVDDDWLWGGDTTAMENTLRYGRIGYMPAYSKTFNESQLNQVSNYVLTLSGEPAVDAAAAVEGQKIFQGETGGCYMCHTSEGTGMHSQGAPNLTDKIWTVANVPAAETPEAKLEAVKAVIHNGVKRQMPAFGEDGRNLSDTEIKVLVAYMQQMSAGAGVQ